MSRGDTLFLTALSLLEATALSHDISLHTDRGHTSAPVLYKIQQNMLKYIKIREHLNLGISLKSAMREMLYFEIILRNQ